MLTGAHVRGLDLAGIGTRDWTRDDDTSSAEPQDMEVALAVLFGSRSRSSVNALNVTYFICTLSPSIRNDGGKGGQGGRG